MGAYMLECDNQIPALLDLLNLRFGPADGTGDYRYAGIEEMAELQREFKVFKPGTPLSHSVKLLGLAGFQSALAKNRWLRLLDNLPNQTDVVRKIVDNLESQAPKPMYFRSVAFGGDWTVMIATGKPIPYDDHEYLIVSIPMKPKPRT